MRRHTVLGDPESTNAIGSSNLGNNLSSFSREVSTEREHEGSRMGLGMGCISQQNTFHHHQQQEFDPYNSLHSKH